MTLEKKWRLMLVEAIEDLNYWQSMDADCKGRSVAIDLCEKHVVEINNLILEKSYV